MLHSGPPLGGLFKWGQININFQSEGLKAKGASSYWGNRNRQLPQPSALLIDQINVDLTPFKKISPHPIEFFLEKNMWKIAVGFAVFAGLALYVISQGGDNIDMTGEKHGAEAVHAPAPAPASK